MSLETQLDLRRLHEQGDQKHFTAHPPSDDDGDDGDVIESELLDFQPPSSFQSFSFHDLH